MPSLSAEKFVLPEGGVVPNRREGERHPYNARLPRADTIRIPHIESLRPSAPATGPSDLEPLFDECRRLGHETWQRRSPDRIRVLIVSHDDGREIAQHAAAPDSPDAKMGLAAWLDRLHDAPVWDAHPGKSITITTRQYGGNLDLDTGIVTERDAPFAITPGPIPGADWLSNEAKRELLGVSS